MPGRNVRAESGQNRTILRNGWSMARSMLEYKTAWRGGALVAVPPTYTSQECSACGHTTAENRKTQAVFECVACGHAPNADRNAARNILRRGQEMLASGRCDSIPSGGCPASTPGHCAELTPVREPPASKETPRRPRPRSAAQRRSDVRGQEASQDWICPGISIHHAVRSIALGWRGCQSAVHSDLGIKASSKIATARVQPADARLIFTGKQLM